VSPAAGHSAEGDLDERHRDLRNFCAALCGGASLVAALVAYSAWQAPEVLTKETPSSLAFGLAFGGMLTVLLSSGVRAAVLRRAVDREEADREEALEEGLPVPSTSERRLTSFTRATRLCFGMLGLASVLALLAAEAGRAPFYGLVVSIASLLGMAVRWPRRVVLEDLLARRDE
jgi:hypothetical protein